MKTIPDSVRDVLDYDPDTGLFARAGSVPIAKPSPDGYIRIGISGRRYLAHRLAWFFVHGTTPQIIDHINHNKTDNRIANLRNVTQSCNLLNRRDSVGVRWRTKDGKRVVRARYRDKTVYSGKSILLAWHRRIMAEREDHPIALTYDPLQ